MDSSQDHLSVSAAAKAFGKSPKTILRWLHSGRLAGSKVEGPYGPEWHIPASAIDAPQQVLDVIPVRREFSPRMVERLIEDALTAHTDAIRAVVREEIAEALDTRAELRDVALVAKIREALRESSARRRRFWPWGH